jgi:hypothetical protein
MPAQTPVDVLRAALAALPAVDYTADRERLGPLHQKVCDVVDELKATGMNPEHVVLAVKGIAFEAMMGPLADVLIEKLVGWCLEQYFKDPARRSAPP